VLRQLQDHAERVHAGVTLPPRTWCMNVNRCGPESLECPRHQSTTQSPIMERQGYNARAAQLLLISGANSMIGVRTLCLHAHRARACALTGGAISASRNARGRQARAGRGSPEPSVVSEL
jgi:hypothetical protein